MQHFKECKLQSQIILVYAGLYKHYPRDRRKAGMAVGQEMVKVIGQSPRPSPASPVIVSLPPAVSSSGRERLASRSGHFSD